MIDTVPVEIAAWLGCLAFILLLLNEGVKFTDRLRGKTPHPPNEQLSVSMSEIERRVAKLEHSNIKIWAKMETDKNEVIRNGEQRAEKIHNRVNDVLQAVSELRGHVDQMNQRHR
jgi:hypothetical protein